MADISTYLAAIMSAVYGEDVRGSIHDAIDIINKVSEVVFSTGTAVSSATSSSAGFYEDSLYLNTNTYELWKCVGTDSWVSLGTMRGVGISSITKTSTAGLVDTYTITYTDGNTSSFAVTNGADGTNGSVWYKGTALTGTGTGIMGFPGNQNDFYLNSTDGYVYTCTATGTVSTATWDYVMTLTGGGGSTVTVIDNLISTSSTDALSANQGRVLKGLVDGNASDITTINGLIPSTATTSNKLATAADIPSVPTVNDATLTIQQNGTNVQTFTANSATAATANIVTDDWVGTATVSSGSVTFTGIDDTTSYGYNLFCNVTSSSTNKSPTAQLTTISGEGTSNMSLTYTTDADNGATCKLRRIK